MKKKICNVHSACQLAESEAGSSSLQTPANM